MEKSDIVAAAETFVVSLLKDSLNDDYQFHNIGHTLQVRQAAVSIGTKEGLSKEALEILELAALFHDTGFSVTYQDHEAASQEIAAQFLQNQGYPEPASREVGRAIQATQASAAPLNLVGQILRDADMYHLGSDDYPEYLKALRHEWRVFLQRQYADAEWLRLNLEFLKKQVYFTPSAWLEYGLGRENNLRAIKKKMRKLQKQGEPKPLPLIRENRSAEMMFKTALRNHIDLSALADNKANMMLSVNALIITIVVPLAADRLREIPPLLPMLAVLLSTCLCAMIFATLATRPMKMPGFTSPAMIREKKSNLFFFGNFFKMDYQDYRDGVSLLLNAPEILEDSIQRDLFFLGKSLGRKYAYLRMCYTVFLGGIIAAVAAFAIAYALT
jgi:predicted metal-dependent HD superfamily phosphohydrolase